MDLQGGRDEWFMTLDYDIAANRQRQLMSQIDSGSSETMNVVVAAPAVRTIAGRPYAFVTGVSFINNLGRASLFKVDLTTGRGQLLEAGYENTEGFVVGADGQPLAESEFDARPLRWTLKVRNPGHGWRAVKTSEGSLDHPWLVGLGRDGHTAVVGSTSEDDKDTFRELAPDAAEWGDVFASGENQGGVFDPATDVLIGTHTVAGDEDRYQFFSPSDQAMWRAVTRAYPDGRVTLASMSTDHRKIVVLVDSPTDGPAYALVDLDKRAGSWIGDVYEGVHAADISPVRPIAFKAADGLALSGYLTTPKGREPKTLPLIVFPHGGPAARDSLGFDWWAQAMAAHGYAVLQVNFRGSDGFGTKHREAGYGQWGRKMQTDLSDGVRYLAAQGVIDPKRVCIVGASYGGYAALAGATLDPGVYRCAASVSGVADPSRFVAWSKAQRGTSALKYWTRFMGVDSAHDPDLSAISPATHAAQSSGPVLLVHGKDDTVVPFEQSQIMADALRKAGKPVEFVTLRKEDHWMSRGETRLQMLQAVIAFLEKNNPPT